MPVDLKNIYFLPLDLPHLEFQDFSRNFAINCESMPETSLNSYSNGIPGKQTENKNYWDQWVCYTHVNGWDPKFIQTYPHEHDILNNLPYEKLIRIYFFRQIKELDPHTDIVTGLYTDYPSAVRFWVINAELDTTFFFIKTNPCGNTIKKFPTYPSDSRWWAMNSTSLSHGSHMPETSKEKIIMGIYGIPKQQEFIQLLQDSHCKYPEYVLSLNDWEKP